MTEDLIYDVGMNNGDDTAYYLARGYRVVAIEADPILVEEGSRRFEREIAAGSVVILNVGISDGEGEMPFWICDQHPEWSTFDASVVREKGADFRQITVSCRRFRSILEEFGTPYYLKLDIEGSEIYCLRDLVVSDLPRYVSFERTPEWTIESLTLLCKLGYSGFKLISQYNYMPVEYPPIEEVRRFEKVQSLLKSRNIFLRVARKTGAMSSLRQEAARARSLADWKFPWGSSGPFGEETLGRWQTFDETVETLATANSSFEERQPSVFWGDEGFSFWADFHVKREA